VEAFSHVVIFVVDQSVVTIDHGNAAAEAAHRLR